MICHHLHKEEFMGLLYRFTSIYMEFTEMTAQNYIHYMNHPV